LHSLRADNGTVLHARLIKPSDFDTTKKYPVLIYVYGGPHAQMLNNSWLAASQLWMQYQAEKGYLIFTLDNRGSKSRGFEFENAIHRQLGTVEMLDQLKGVEWLKSKSFVDSSKMAIHGWSFGGFMTISMMLRNPGIFKAAVAGGPVTDWKYYEVMYGERYMDRPEENPEGYEKAKLANYVKNLNGNLMLIHGTSDDVVLEQHSLSLVKAFVENGMLVDYFPYPMHKHNVLGKDRVHLMRKILNYIDEKLK
jgi:dipeptidyl-peptidase-4